MAHFLTTADGEIPAMTSNPTRPLRRFVLGGLAATVTAASLAACAPTIKLEVAPIQIYAKLDADVRIKLDQELQNLLRENPNLF